MQSIQISSGYVFGQDNLTLTDYTQPLFRLGTLYWKTLFIQSTGAQVTYTDFIAYKRCRIYFYSPSGIQKFLHRA
jgi:hypothetical protein